jgi:exopolysaccharide biosynthesis WecB/TagA/CpsF family protein
MGVVMLPSFVVDGLRVTALTVEEAAESICAGLRRGAGLAVFTMNLDHVVKIRRNAVFAAAYQRAGLILPDGFPIVLAGRLQGVAAQRATGADLILPLCRAAARDGLPIALVGSTAEALAGAARRLELEAPSLRVVARIAPPHGFDALSADADSTIREIRASGARICFLAFGAPKQELLADRAASQLPDVAFLCIGAGLDFLAGEQRRAPLFFQKTGLEWVWRLALAPRRLGARYLACLGVLPSVLVGAVARR